MSAAELLTELTTLGATLQVQGQHLRIEAPVGVLTPERQSRLVEQKAALLTLVQPPSRRAYLCAGCKRVFFPEPAMLCYWCRRSRQQKPVGPPCGGCGEACEDCLSEHVRDDGNGGT